jgi:hypothetical protein
MNSNEKRTCRINLPVRILGDVRNLKDERAANVYLLDCDEDGMDATKITAEDCCNYWCIASWRTSSGKYWVDETSFVIGKSDVAFLYTIQSKEAS